ncbi:MAG: HNH endonuclease signature motif containing protein, partial [Gallionella sp.]
KPCARIRSSNYYKENKDACLARMTKRRKENPEKIKTERANSYAKNPDKAKKDAAKWYFDNHDKARKTRNVWVKENPLVKKESDARWAKENPEKCRINRENYRSRKSGGTLSRDISQKLFLLQKGICACGCKQQLGSDYHLDHRMPLAIGGSNTDDNMQLLTSTCNLQKGKKHPVDFMQSRGFLL